MGVSSNFLTTMKILKKEFEKTHPIKLSLVSGPTGLLYAQIKRGAFTFDERYWSSVSSEAQLFIKSLLQVDPSKRPSAAAAMNHDWFTKHATELSTTDLSKTIDNMKKWNARRKLKGGIKAVMASNRVAAAARGGQ